MKAHSGEASIQEMANLLQVSRSGYYKYLVKTESPRDQANQALLVAIQASYAASRETYGSPRIHKDLRATGPCFFAVTVIDAKGKARKTYPYDQIMTPYERFKSLPDAARYLKKGLTFALLDEKAMQETDMESGKKMQEARKKLFLTLFAKQKGELQLS